MRRLASETFLGTNDRCGWADGCDRATRIFLLVLIFWLPFGKAVVETCVIAAVLLWGCRRWLCFRRRVDPTTPLRDKINGLASSFRPQPTYLDGSIAVFLSLCVLSAAGSVLPLKSLHAFFTKILEWFVIFFLVVEFFPRGRHLINAIHVFIFSGFSLCVDAILQYHWLGHDLIFQRGLSRGGATASLSHANALGGYLTFFVPVVLAYLCSYWKTPWQRWGGLGALVLGIWTAGITLSRGTWIGLAAGLCYFVWRTKAGAVRLILAGAMIIAAVGIVTLSPQAKRHFRIDVENLVGSCQWRGDLWADTLVMVRDRPLFGHGLNLFMDVFQEYRKKYDGRYPFDPAYAHNSFLQMTGDIGILGAGSFLAIMLRLFFRERRRLVGHKNTAGSDLRLLRTGSLAGCLAFLVHSFFEVHLYSLQLVALFWFMIGLIVSLDNLLNMSANCDKKVPV